MSVGVPYEGQKFASFDVLKKYLEEYGQRNYVKFWIRSSHTIGSLKSRSNIKMNPDLKYVCMKFACIFGGEKIRCRGSGIRRSTTYRNPGCPCMINAVVGDDGNHVRLDTVILEHNHALCKSLYDSLKKSKSKLGFRVLQNDNQLNKKSLLKKHFNSEIKLCLEGNVGNGCTIVDDINSKSNTETLHKEIVDKKETYPEVVENDFQHYLNEIRQKYGSNVKIIVVNNKEENGNEKTVVRTKPSIKSKTVKCETFDEPLGVVGSSELVDDYELANVSKQKEICRLCLSSNNKLTPIFKPSLPLESTILSFKIMSCASIEVRSDDDLPCHICTTCEEILDIAYNFRMRCENSDSILRKAYSNQILNVSNISNENVYSEIMHDMKEEEQVKVASQCKNLDFSEPIKNEKEIVLDCSNASDYDLYEKFNEKCPICSKAFEYHIEMLNHMREHSDVENYLLTCNLCNVIFTTVKSLLAHMDEHLVDINTEWDSKIHVGPQGELTFLSAQVEPKTEEDSHMLKEEETPQNEKISTTNGYLCNICGKILKSKDRFQSHRNTHEGLRPHVCLKCGRGFADRKNMHQHYDIVHLRKAKHECPICRKRFYAPTKMKSHITMHYGVKPFECDVCSKTFRLRMNMIKHKKTHSNERPYKCDKCSAAFIDKNLLTRHSYVHGGVRPYVCPLCGHRFTLKFNLKKHMASGRCYGKNKSVVEQEGNEEELAAVEQWTEMVAPTPDGRSIAEGEIIKCEDGGGSQFPQEPESIEINMLTEYEEKE